MITKISVSDNSTVMQLEFANNETVPLSARFLRENAMDAWSRRERIEHGAISVAADIQIAKVRAVGHTGLNITFSDGNERAIFPYSYLQSLAGHPLTTS